jgi:Tol biopolymer transport system component
LLCWTRNEYPGGGVWIAHDDGSSPILLVSGGRAPDWNPVAPDTLVCVLTDTDTRDTSLLAVSVTTGNYRILFTTGTSEDMHTPRYSPDASAIAFHYVKDGGRHSGIYVLALGASAPVVLTEEHAIHPTWSPSGQEVTFLAWDAHSHSATNGTIWTINTNTKSARQLTQWWPSTCEDLP